MKFVLPFLLSASCISCATTTPKTTRDSAPLPNEPVSMQLPRVEPSLRGVKYSLLLDFENQRDLVFLNTPESGSDETHRHTGFRSLQLGAKTRSTIKLASLMSGRPFPGDYTLVGAYVRAGNAATVTLRCLFDGYAPLTRTITVSGGEWKPLLIDLSDLKPSSDPSKQQVATLEIITDAIVYLDDVLIIDNNNEIVPLTDGGWVIAQKGFRYRVERPTMFSVTLDSAEGKADGWEIEESCAVRARFRSTGLVKSLTIYNDGRSYWDGEFKGLSSAVRDDAAFALQQDSGARVEIPEEVGKLIRNSGGDDNADGFNELRGAYLIQASASRLQINLQPGRAPVVRPVFEITGFPLGKVLVNVEGQIVDAATRLQNGTVLVVLPLRFERAVSISLRVE